MLPECPVDTGERAIQGPRCQKRDPLVCDRDDDLGAGPSEGSRVRAFDDSEFLARVVLVLKERNGLADRVTGAQTDTERVAILQRVGNGRSFHCIARRDRC